MEERGEDGRGEGRRGYERGMRGGRGLRVHACTYTNGSFALTPIIISLLITQEEKHNYFSGFSDGLLLKKAKKQGEMPLYLVVLGD